ncbi:MAG: tyrosine--tRNA ligase, partial [Chloroflexi bacterium]|nr:tyrosine--tRNA ligase [Chloroflexota bacterium]
NGIYILDEPRDQFGKIMSMNDDVITLYMESCTRVPMREVEQIKSGLAGGSVHPMDAKKRLAWEIVRMYHGEAAADQAKADFERQFQERGIPTEIPIVPVEQAAGGRANQAGEVGILDLLINTGLAPNRKQAQRLVEQGGVRVDEERVTARTYTLKPLPGMILKAGRSFVKLEA